MNKFMPANLALVRHRIRWVLLLGLIFIPSGGKALDRGSAASIGQPPSPRFAERASRRSAAWEAVPTPFQPQQPANGVESTFLPLLTQSNAAVHLPPSDFYGIDFSPQGKEISIQINPPDKRVNQGKPILIAFIPGHECVFGDHHACINTYQTAPTQSNIFMTVHSGVGGEAQAYRHALEGTGKDQAGFRLRQVKATLNALTGSEVTITQGETVLRGLTLAGTARIPPTRLEEYYDTPIQDILAFAGRLNPALVPLLHPDQPQIIFETCGWRMPGEPWVKGITPTSASIYLGVIQKRP
jgi:hypothetical protein